MANYRQNGTAVINAVNCGTYDPANKHSNISIEPMTQMLAKAPWNNQVGKNLGVEGMPKLTLQAGYLASYPMPISLSTPPNWIVRGGKA